MTDPLHRPDPRDRPPDPAGTQPKVDPESLLPTPLEPAVDAEAVEEDDAGEAPPGAELVAAGGRGLEPAAEDAGESRHAPRFQFLWGALAAVAIIAVGAAVLVATGGSTRTVADTWSPWHPSGPDPVAAIADHVAPEYRLSNGDELVLVTGGPLEIAGLPMQIALRERPAAGGDIQLLDGTGVLYRLCGLGDRCSIDRGRKRSVQQRLLLRREALELALYTLRYVKDVDDVVVFLPPRPGSEPSQALLFRHGDMGAELSRPLRATLSRRTPSVAGVDASPDSALVRRITAPTLYTFSLTQANQDASVFLVLEPFTAGARAG